MTPIYGQTANASTALNLYTVSTGKVAKVEKLYIAERAGGTPTYTVWVIPQGESVGDQHAIALDAALTANDAVEIGPFYMNAGDIIRVESSDANVSFTANGYERDAS